jgi:hypothetical protein
MHHFDVVRRAAQGGRLLLKQRLPIEGNAPGQETSFLKLRLEGTSQNKESSKNTARQGWTELTSVPSPVLGFDC